MPGPVINDDFWFEYSGRVVTQSIEAIDNAAGKLQNYSIWLWGIYTAGAGIGFSLAGKDLPIQGKLFIAIPSVLLILVYFCTVWVQLPVLTKFDPNSPTKIERSYADALRTKKARIRLTSLIAGLSGISVALCLLFASTVKESTGKIGPGNSRLVPRDGRIGVSGYFGNAPTVRVQLVWRSGNTTNLGIPMAFAPIEGRLQVSIPLTNNMNALTNAALQFEWMSDETFWHAERKINLLTE